MTSDDDWVALTTVKTAFEGEWLVGALKGFDIPATTHGEDLADGFAVSQRAMGLGGGARVVVRRGDLDRAREALTQIEENKPTPDELAAAVDEAVGGEDAEEDEEDDPPPPYPITLASVALVVLALTVLVLGWFYVRVK